MINNKYLFDYVKDHVEHFGFFPYDYEDSQTEEVIKYPDYMSRFSSKEIEELSKLFNKHEEYNGK